MSTLYCPTCGGNGHLPDKCWKTYPELRRQKKIQGVDGDDAELLGIVICACEEDEGPPQMLTRPEDFHARCGGASLLNDNVCKHEPTM